MELKARELRIGNWLRFDNMISEPYNYQVSPRMFRQMGYDISDNLELKINNYHKPIPITEDILLKCGFRKDEDISYRWYFDFGWAVIIAYDLDDNCVRIGDSWDFSKLIYVHELQNLIFALTKTELTINL
jgi:hypothetical protein